MDGKTFINLVAKEIGVASKYSVFPELMNKMAGLFNKNISEAYEMLYQSEYEYHFDSSKFNKYFNYSPKSYYEGISETIEFLKSK